MACQESVALVGVLVLLNLRSLTSAHPATQILAYYGFVNFNWSRVGATIGNTLEITDNG